MTRMVFCDVAGTLVEGNPWDYVQRHPLIDAGRSRRALWRFLPVWAASKLKLVPDRTMRHQWLHSMAALFEGLSREQLAEVFRATVNEEMADLYHADVLARLREHQRSGARVVLVSGMFAPMVRAFAERVGADDAIGTALAFDGDVCLGRVAGETCVGPRKLMFIAAYLRREAPTISLAACTAYADSTSDIPLLTAAGTGVATYPDAGMLRAARAEGWPILGQPM